MKIALKPCQEWKTILSTLSLHLHHITKMPMRQIKVAINHGQHCVAGRYPMTNIMMLYHHANTKIGREKSSANVCECLSQMEVFSITTKTSWWGGNYSTKVGLRFSRTSTDNMEQRFKPRKRPSLLSANYGVYLLDNKRAEECVF